MWKSFLNFYSIKLVIYNKFIFDVIIDLVRKIMCQFEENFRFYEICPFLLINIIAEKKSRNWYNSSFKFIVYNSFIFYELIYLEKLGNYV